MGVLVPTAAPENVVGVEVLRRIWNRYGGVSHGMFEASYGICPSSARQCDDDGERVSLEQSACFRPGQKPKLRILERSQVIIL